MDIIDSYVINTRMGNKIGRIVATPNYNRVVVRYNDSDEEKIHIFPNAFWDCLRFADLSMQEEIERLRPVLRTDIGVAGPTIEQIEEFPPFPTVQPFWVERDDASASVLRTRRLEKYHWYGSSGEAIYLNCCDAFGWDGSRSGEFGQRSLLYGKRITAENYSVWFLPHHSWIERDWNGRKWFNHIGRDVIYEDWDDNAIEESDRHNLNYDFSSRLTFAKGKNGKYYYIGIFKPVGIIRNQVGGGRFYHTKIYKRIDGDNFYPRRQRH